MERGAPGAVASTLRATQAQLHQPRIALASHDCVAQECTSGLGFGDAALPRRRPLLAAAASAAACAALGAAGRRPARARGGGAGGDERLASRVTVPLLWREGAFGFNYSLIERRADGVNTGSSFWGVADTGSPFLLVGRCLRRDCPEYCSQWGCFAGNGVPFGLKDTVEVYVSGEARVEWRRGVDLAFLGANAAPEGAAPEGAALAARDLVFGVQNEVAGRGGTGNGVFIGLVRSHAADIRPSFLEQTPFTFLAFDLRTPGREALTLLAAPRSGWRFGGAEALLTPVEGGVVGTLRMVDPQAWGDPVSHYAVITTAVVVGGRRLPPVAAEGDVAEEGRRPRRVLCIFDTGTTGVSMTPGLHAAYYNEAMKSAAAGSIPFSQARRLEFVFEQEGGGELVLDMFAGRHPQYGPGLDLVTMVEEVAWAGIGDPQSLSSYRSPDGRTALGGDVAQGLPFDDVAFLGLGFLLGRRLVFDATGRRLAIDVARTVPPGAAVAPSRAMAGQRV